MWMVTMLLPRHRPIELNVLRAKCKCCIRVFTLRASVSRPSVDRKVEVWREA